MKAAISKEKWEKLDDAAKAGYKVSKNDEDVYVLIVDEAMGYGMANIGDLTGSLSKERAARKEADKKLNAFGEITPKEAKAAIKKAAGTKPEEDTQKIIDTKVAEAIAGKNEEIETLKGENESLKGAGTEATIDKAVSEAISDHKANHKLLSLPLRSVVAMHDIDGKPTAVVVNSKGEPVYNKEGKIMLPGEHVGTVMKADKDYAAGFPSEEKGGGNAGTKTTPGLNPASGDPDAPMRNPQQKLRELREKQEA